MTDQTQPASAPDADEIEACIADDAALVREQYPEVAENMNKAADALAAQKKRIAELESSAAFVKAYVAECMTSVDLVQRAYNDTPTHELTVKLGAALQAWMRMPQVVAGTVVNQREKQKAERIAALEADAELHAALLTAAKTLPEGFILSVAVEKGAGWVDLSDPEFAEVKLPDAGDKTLAQQVRDALAAALKETP